jgi:hypothetical protein
MYCSIKVDLLGNGLTNELYSNSKNGNTNTTALTTVLSPDQRFMLKYS